MPAEQLHSSPEREDVERVVPNDGGRQHVDHAAGRADAWVARRLPDSDDPLVGDDLEHGVRESPATTVHPGFRLRERDHHDGDTYVLDLHRCLPSLVDLIAMPPTAPYRSRALRRRRPPSRRRSWPAASPE